MRTIWVLNLIFSASQGVRVKKGPVDCPADFGQGNEAQCEYFNGQAPVAGDESRVFKVVGRNSVMKQVAITPTSGWHIGAEILMKLNGKCMDSSLSPKDKAKYECTDNEQCLASIPRLYNYTESCRDSSYEAFDKTKFCTYEMELFPDFNELDTNDFNEKKLGANKAAIQMTKLFECMWDHHMTHGDATTKDMGWNGEASETESKGRLVDFGLGVDGNGIFTGGVTEYKAWCAAVDMDMKEMSLDRLVNDVKKFQTLCGMVGATDCNAEYDKVAELAAEIKNSLDSAKLMRVTEDDEDEDEDEGPECTGEKCGVKVGNAGEKRRTRGVIIKEAKQEAKQLTKKVRNAVLGKKKK